MGSVGADGCAPLGTVITKCGSRVYIWYSHFKEGGCWLVGIDWCQGICNHHVNDLCCLVSSHFISGMFRLPSVPPKECKVVIMATVDCLVIGSTVQYRYNAVNFLPNPHNRHPIAHPWGWAMGCLLWFWYQINFLPLLSLSFVISWKIRLHYNSTWLYYLFRILLIFVKSFILFTRKNACFSVIHSTHAESSGKKNPVTCHVLLLALGNDI